MVKTLINQHNRLWDREQDDRRGRRGGATAHVSTRWLEVFLNAFSACSLFNAHLLQVDTVGTRRCSAPPVSARNPEAGSQTLATASSFAAPRKQHGLPKSQSTNRVSVLTTRSSLFPEKKRSGCTRSSMSTWRHNGCSCLGGWCVGHDADVYRKGRFACDIDIQVGRASFQ